MSNWRRLTAPSLLAGLLLAACGGAPDSSLEAEPLGTAQEALDSTLSCTRTSTTTITCTGGASNGVSPYTPMWQELVEFSDGSTYDSGWYEGGGFTNYIYCRHSTVRWPADIIQLRSKVRDATGAESLRFGPRYFCVPRPPSGHQDRRPPGTTVGRRGERVPPWS